MIQDIYYFWDKFLQRRKKLYLLIPFLLLFNTVVKAEKQHPMLSGVIAAYDNKNYDECQLLIESLIQNKQLKPLDRATLNYYQCRLLVYQKVSSDIFMKQARHLNNYCFEHELTNKDIYFKNVVYNLSKGFYKEEALDSALFYLNQASPYVSDSISPYILKNYYNLKAILQLSISTLTGTKRYHICISQVHIHYLLTI